MHATELRTRGDRELAERLGADAFVRSALERLEAESAQTPTRVRRQLLSTSLRLTADMMPDVHATIDGCRERLGIEIPLEVYVYPSADFNAACVKPEDGRLFILLSSSLLESFPEGERRFVIGHELGHHLFGHHDLPVGLLLQTHPGPELALRLFAWSRYAEISADRAGAHCVDDRDDVARALFRLASGLKQPLAGVHIEEFAEQVDQLVHEQAEAGRGASESDWFATHPFSPLRLKAARFFFDSEFFVEGGAPAAELEARVQDLMALMEPSYLEGRDEESEIARRLLFAGAIAVADATGGIAEAEIAAFERFFGEGAFTEQLDVAGLKASLDERVRVAKERLSHGRRIQVLRDLGLIAEADGRTSKAERAVVVSVARALDVPLEIVETRAARCCEA